MTLTNWIFLYLVLAMAYTIYAYNKNEYLELPIIIPILFFWAYPPLDLISWIDTQLILFKARRTLKRVYRILKKNGASEEDLQKVKEAIDLL